MFTKIVARFLLPVFTVFVLFQPAIATAATPTFRMGSTFYPKTTSGAVGAAVDVVALAGRANPWIGAIALGYQLYQFAQSFTDSTGAARSALVVANGQNVPTPSGWTTDTNGNLVPPSTANIVTLYQDSSTSWGNCSSPYTYSTVDALAQCLQTRYTTVLGWPSATYTISSLNITFTLINGTTQQTTTHIAQAIQSCPTGYTSNGTSCSLSTPSSVMYPSDGMPTLRGNADGSGFTLDPRDPDNSSAPNLPASITTDAGATVGNDTQLTVSNNSSGGLNITTMQEYKNSDGTITTYKQTVSTNASGAVTTTNAANYPGAISQQSTSSTAIAPSTSATINLPTDYARQGEAATAAKSITDALSAPPTTDPNLATENAQLSTNANAQQQFLQGLGAKGQGNEGGALSWSLPQPVIQDNTCTDPSFTILSGTSFQRTIDFAGFCSNLMKARSILQWVLYVLTLYALFDIVSGRRVEE